MRDDEPYVPPVYDPDSESAHFVKSMTNERDRPAGEDYPDKDVPHTFGFIQPGWYYTNETMKYPEFIYVARIHGDGGTVGGFGKENFIDAVSVGPTPERDRPFTQTRIDLRSWATKRISREDMPKTIPPSGSLRLADEYAAQKAAYIQQQPIPDYTPSERPR